MDLSKAIKLSTEVSPQLFLCSSKDEIEKVFSSFEIKNIHDKIGLLQLCMGIKNTSPSPCSKELTLEQQYEDIVLVFLDGSWRFLL